MSAQKLFFSYSRSDSTFALKLAKDLRDAGAEIWIDQLDIPAGNHWDAAVEKALNSAAYVLVILSPSSTASTNVMDEVSFALEAGKKIIPVLLDDCLAPFRLRRLQRIDFTTDYASGFNQLVQSLNLVVNQGPKSDGGSGIIEHISPQPQGPSLNEQNENQKRENLLWEEACRLNTIASYKYYLNESLSGEYKTEARLLIKQLEVEQKEDELEALLWQQAKTENSRNLYQHYLQEYPQGNYKTLALAAVADLEKAEKDEQNRLKEIEKQQEKEKALQAKQEKDKLAQQEKEKALREKEEREKIRQQEKEKQLLEKQERDKEKQLEKEKQLLEKQARDKEKQLEKEKTIQEKQEREKLKQQEREKALAENGQAGTQPQSGGQKRLILIGAGVLILALGIWGLTQIGGSSGDGDLDAWNTAVSKNDSAAYAMYRSDFPTGKYLIVAQRKLDSLNTISRNRQESQRVEEDAAQTATQPAVDTTRKTQSGTKTDQPVSKTEPVKKVTTPPAQSPTKSKAPTQSKTPPKFTLGQQHQGGIIIFINASGEHGLVTALKEEGKSNWAAAQRRCASYKVAGFTDWRLPTRDELGVIYDNRKHLGTYTKGIYWSGTEDGKDIAWGVNFINGAPGKYDKQSDNSVWAVHAF